MNNIEINFDELRNLTIGTIEFISPREIKVLLDINAPQNTALNTGVPTLFPKINGYILIPNEAGALVGIISWIGIEHSPYPKRKGLKDFDLIDLPFPLRKMSVSPLGNLKKVNGDYEIERGVYSYPSVGDPVVIPTQKQLQAIVENKSIRAKVRIGTSPLAANTPVYVDPDKIFGRHIAVLGNTGSGKSCSVAGLIRWSLESAKKEIETNKKQQRPNARFIILDPNGEYTDTFDDCSDVRKFKVLFGNDDPKINQLRVPSWMWNSYEWSSITRASSGTQRPLLRQSLRAMRNNITEFVDDIRNEIRNFLGTLLVSIKSEISTGQPWGSFPKPKNFTEKIKKWHQSIEHYLGKLQESTKKTKLNELNDIIKDLLLNRSGQYPTYDFNTIEINGIKDKIQETYTTFGGTSYDLMPKSEDAPIQFDTEIFINYLDILSNEHNAIQYMDYLMMRIKTILTDTRMSTIISNEDDINLTQWLEEYIGKNNAENGEITIIDLSLVPNDIIHIVVSVIARIIFEALQRYRKINKELLPTVIVMEEAHNYISRYNTDNEELSQTRLCSETFERIAKEGRKFGLGLMLSSQRPAELSPTVLSQCNTFLLHRLVNDRDQELVKKFVPDNLGSILNELPILPTRKAILLGWAAPIPILIEMNELKKEHQPNSDDPDFWDVWTGEKKREVDWKEIVDEWQGVTEKHDDSASIENNGEKPEIISTSDIPNEDTKLDIDDVPF